MPDDDFDDDLRSTQKVLFIQQAKAKGLWGVDIHPFGFYNSIVKTNIRLVIQLGEPILTEMPTIEELAAAKNVIYSITFDTDGYYLEGERKTFDEICTFAKQQLEMLREPKKQNEETINNDSTKTKHPKTPLKSALKSPKAPPPHSPNVRFATISEAGEKRKNTLGVSEWKTEHVPTKRYSNLGDVQTFIMSYPEDKNTILSNLKTEYTARRNKNYLKRYSTERRSREEQLKQLAEALFTLKQSNPITHEAAAQFIKALDDIQKQFKAENQESRYKLGSSTLEKMCKAMYDKMDATLPQDVSQKNRRSTISRSFKR